MTRTKKLTVALAVAALAGATALCAVPGGYAEESTPEKTEVRVVEELTWEGSPTCGWGQVLKNLHPGGGALTVGGVTYTENSIGTHMPEAYGAQDIVYDISAWSTDYPYLDMYVAMADSGGVNNVNFIALVDDVEVDRVHWNWTAFRKNNAPMSYDDANTPAAHKPLALRAYVGGGKKLTLRLLGGDNTSSYSYANGACAFLDVKLLKDTWDGYTPATRIYDRHANPGIGGWSVGYGDGMAFDTNIVGDPLSYMMYDDRVAYDSGMCVHLKNVAYEAYSAAKDNANNYVSLKWDISKYDYSLFSTLVYAPLGYGFHVDAWIDGEEAYTSGKIDSIGTLVHDGVDAKTAPKEIAVAIPAGAREFELRIVADTVFNDGQIVLACPIFFERGNKLISFNGVQTAGEVYKMQSPRTYMYNGNRASYYDGATGASVTAEDGLFFVAGTSYTFDVSDAPGNTVIGKLGKSDFGHLDDNTSPLHLDYTVTYENGTSKTGSTEQVEKTTSGREVSVYIGENAKTLTLTLYTENPSFSESVFAGATFTDMYNVSFNDGVNTTSNAYLAGAELVKPEDPQKAGYTFGGWMLAGESEAYDFTNKTVSSDMSFTAIWNVNTYKVKYSVKLGNADPTAGDYPQGEYSFDADSALPEAKTVAGYDFVGWYVGESKVELLAAGTYTADIDVVAVYAKKSYTVTFKNGDDTLDTVTVEHGENASAISSPVKIGHTFVGWKNGEEVFDFSSPITGDMTLIAEFAPAVYNVTYKQQLGSATATNVTYTPATHTFGTDTDLPEAKAVDGYVFVGWYVGENAVTKLDAESYTANITVVAKYRKAPLSVIFVDDGVEYPVEYDEGQTVTPKPVFREGYEFVGWYTDEEFTEEYNFDAPLSAGVRLYAKWKKLDEISGNGDGNDGSLSGGAIAGIVVGSVAAVGACAAAAVVVTRRKKKKTGDNADADGNDGDNG